MATGERVSGYRVSGDTLSPWWPWSGPPSRTLGLGAAGHSAALHASPAPDAHPAQSLVIEEIQEGNQSGCQCPGDRLAPQPPGPRSPAAALTVPPQSTGGEQRARRTPAGPWPPHWGGQLGVWRQTSYQPQLDQEATPWLGLAFRPRKVGREGPQHLT